MISLILLFSINVSTYPQNAMWDRYTIIPPLGTIRSIAASDLEVFATSDRYLLFVSKLDYTLKKSLYFDCDLELVGYDNYTTDLWLTCTDMIIRLNTMTYALRTFPVPGAVNRFTFDAKHVFFESAQSGERFALDKITGVLSSINNFPQNLKWYKRTSENDIRAYPFLNPYYYYDDPQFSQVPFQTYPITALYDDGMYLYVGTDRYGLLKYDKVSWDSRRIIYGPLDSHIKTVKKFGKNICFLSASGISYPREDLGRWSYLRLNKAAADLVAIDDEIFLARSNRVFRTSDNLEFPVGDFTTSVLALGSDSAHIYIGTNSGLFRIAKDTRTKIPFGPDMYAVYYIYPTTDAVYVGGEFALYKYVRAENEWTTVLSFGVKDIVEINNSIYALGTNNQIMRYVDAPNDSLPADTSWYLLPYFNIYDIDTDNEVLYCATYAGIHYYDPASSLYKAVYNLPRIDYEYVFFVDNTILAISRDAVYSLPLEHRD